MEGHRPELVWLPILIGLVALYSPTFWSLGKTVWQDEEQAHGPIILAVSAWLLWQLRTRLVMQRPSSGEALGWLALSVGLAIYVLGRSQDLVQLDVGSIIPIALGALLVLGGRDALRLAWFPVFFLAFMVPVPGLLIDAATGPLKQAVSASAESILYLVGYPIARSGVMLTIGQYQLLVADACSGLNSMFSLSALGVLYLYLMRSEGTLRNGILLACILPIAFVANIVRVIILVLVTYHFGDEAGQGFIHGVAGMVLFVVALLLLFSVDSMLRIAGRLFSGAHRSRRVREELSSPNL